MRRPLRCARCRRPRSTGAWPQTGRSCKSGAGHTPNRGHCSRTRTWADWDDAVPGFVEIDLVGHEGGDPSREHAYTLTDIATGWTENRSVRNRAQRWVFAAPMDIRDHLPFLLLGIDSGPMDGSACPKHRGGRGDEAVGLKTPDGRCAMADASKSACTFSMIAWRRCVWSALTVSRSVVVKNAWKRQVSNSVA